MADKKQTPAPSDQARRELDRDYTGQAKNARGDAVENELDQETFQLRNEFDSDAPKNRR